MGDSEDFHWEVDFDFGHDLALDLDFGFDAALGLLCPPLFFFVFLISV